MMRSRPAGNAVDDRLIGYLARDGRITSRQLARLLEISEGAVRARLKRLMASGLSVRALVNPAKVGFPVTAVLGLKVDLGSLGPAVRQLADNEHVAYVSQVTGGYDIIAVGMFRSLQEIIDVSHDVLTHLQGIREIQTNICLETELGYYMSARSNVMNAPPPGQTPVDDIDMSIMRLLAGDGRMSSAQIANELSLAQSTAQRRLKRLITSGVITIRAKMAADKMGFPVVAVTGLKVDATRTREVAARLAANPQVAYVAICAGAFDIIFTGLYRSNQDLNANLQKSVAPLEGVKGVETHICIEGEQGYFAAFVPRARPYAV